MARPRGCWLEASVPLPVYRSIKLCMLLPSERGTQQQTIKGAGAPCGWVFKVSHCYFFSFKFFFLFYYFGFFLSEMSHQVQPTLKRKWTVVWEYALYGFIPLKVNTFNGPLRDQFCNSSSRLEKTALGFSVLYVFPDCLFKSICLLIFFCLFDQLITPRTMLKSPTMTVNLCIFPCNSINSGGIF